MWGYAFCRTLWNNDLPPTTQDNVNPPSVGNTKVGLSQLLHNDLTTITWANCKLSLHNLYKRRWMDLIEMLYFHHYCQVVHALLTILNLASYIRQNIANAHNVWDAICCGLALHTSNSCYFKRVLVSQVPYFPDYKAYLQWMAYFSYITSTGL